MVGEALPREAVRAWGGHGLTVAETYGDKNGYNARKRRKSDAGYIHRGGGSVACRRRGGRGAVQRKATPVTYSKTDATVEAGSRRAPSAVRVVAASRGTKRLAP